MTSAPQSSPGLRRLPAWAALVCTLLAVVGAPRAAQAPGGAPGGATVSKEPGSATQLARLGTARPRPTGTVRGEWAEVSLEGWLPAAAITKTDRAGFDVIVRSNMGPDLRTAPGAGAVVARLRPGVLLDSVGGQAGWVRVRRVGWVPRGALTAPSAAPAGTAQAAAPPAPPRPSQDTARATPPAAPASAVVPGAAGPGEGAAAAGDRVETVRSATLHAAPDAPALAAMQPGAAARVVGRAGGWVRVQVDGWMRETDVRAAGSGALSDVTAAELRADPARFVGQTVDWRVQFIAVQVADELRPELPQGQPYLLVRGPLPEPGFIYVALPRARVAEFRALAPLQELVLRATIRSAQSRYLPTPVVEFVSARPVESSTGR